MYFPSDILLEDILNTFIKLYNLKLSKVEIYLFYLKEVKIIIIFSLEEFNLKVLEKV